MKFIFGFSNFQVVQDQPPHPPNRAQLEERRLAIVSKRNESTWQFVKDEITAYAHSLKNLFKNVGFVCLLVSYGKQMGLVTNLMCLCMMAIFCQLPE